MLGVLLTGGASSRMGQDKARLDWFGVRMDQHLAQLLHLAGCQQVIRAGSPDCPDPLPGRGPLGGLLAAARQQPEQALLVCPVDMPLLTPGLLRQLVHDIRACRYQHQQLPCYLPARPDLVPLLEQLLATGTPRACSLKNLLQQLDARELHCAQPERLYNANTPAQYRQCLALAQRLNQGEC